MTNRVFRIQNMMSKKRIILNKEKNLAQFVESTTRKIG